MKKLLLLFGLAACGGGGGGGTIEKVEGTASIGGKPAKITSCKAVGMRHGEVQYTAVELGLDSGHTVLVDTYAGSTIRKGGEPTKLSDCPRIGGRSTASGAASKAWAQGELDLVCPTADGELKIEATYDCGSTSRPSNRVDRDKK